MNPCVRNTELICSANIHNEFCPVCQKSLGLDTSLIHLHVSGDLCVLVIVWPVLFSSSFIFLFCLDS
jgi:hypothetical protein